MFIGWSAENEFCICHLVEHCMYNEERRLLCDSHSCDKVVSLCFF